MEESREEREREYLDLVASGVYERTGALRQLEDEFDSARWALERIVGVFGVLGYDAEAEDARAALVEVDDLFARLPRMKAHEKAEYVKRLK
jgi:hypothetical protein